VRLAHLRRRGGTSNWGNKDRHTRDEVPHLMCPMHGGAYVAGAGVGACPMFLCSTILSKNLTAKASLLDLRVDLQLQCVGTPPLHVSVRRLRCEQFMMSWYLYHCCRQPATVATAPPHLLHILS
jgi:hypothetical protein